MTDLFVNKVKTATGYALMPAHESDLEAIKKLPVGQPLRVKITKMRNVQFHRKIMALITLLFDYWEPDDSNIPAYLSVRGIEPQKNWDRFRKDLIIAAGFYDATFRLNGDVRVEAKSMAFDRLTEEEAEELFNKIIDIGLNMVSKNYTEEQLRTATEQIMGFTT